MVVFQQIFWIFLNILVLGFIAYVIVAFAMILTLVPATYLDYQRRKCYYKKHLRLLPSRQKHTPRYVSFLLGVVLLTVWGVLVYLYLSALNFV